MPNKINDTRMTHMMETAVGQLRVLTSRVNLGLRHGLYATADLKANLLHPMQIFSHWLERRVPCRRMLLDRNFAGRVPKTRLKP